MSRITRASRTRICPGRRYAQELTAVAVAMRQQHEGKHGGIADLQHHAPASCWPVRPSSDVSRTTTFLGGGLAVGVVGAAVATCSTLSGGLVPDDGQRLERSPRQLAFPAYRSGRAPAAPNWRSREWRTASRTGQERSKRDSDTAAAAAGLAGKVRALQCAQATGVSINASTTAAGRRNQEVAGQIAQDAHGADRQYHQRSTNSRTAPQMDGGHSTVDLSAGSTPQLMACRRAGRREVARESDPRVRRAGWKPG